MNSYGDISSPAQSTAKTGATNPPTPGNAPSMNITVIPAIVSGTPVYPNNVGNVAKGGATNNG